MHYTLCLHWLIVMNLVGMWCISSSRWHFELHGRKVSCCKFEFFEGFWCNWRHQKSVGECLSRNCFLCRYCCCCCTRFCRSSKLILLNTIISINELTNTHTHTYTVFKMEKCLVICRIETLIDILNFLSKDPCFEIFRYIN